MEAKVVVFSNWFLTLGANESHTVFCLFGGGGGSRTHDPSTAICCTSN